MTMNTIRQAIADFWNDTAGTASIAHPGQDMRRLSDHHLRDVGLTHDDVASLGARNLSQISARRSGNW